jgi:hypothetical protein
MEAEQRRAAKEQMVALMQAGHRWQEAAAQAGIPISRSTAYRRLAPGAEAWESRFRGWKTRAPCQTTHSRAGLAGNLLPHVARHSKPCGADSLAGTVRHPDQYRLSEPGPCPPRPGKAPSCVGGKNWMRIRPHQLNPSGKRAQEGCSWLQRPRRLVCSPRWKPPYLHALPVTIRAWRTCRRGLVTCWCECCSFLGRSDWSAPGICVPTRAMR